VFGSLETESYAHFKLLRLIFNVRYVESNWAIWFKALAYFFGPPQL
jgi:hypothetical protein